MDNAIVPAVLEATLVRMLSDAALRLLADLPNEPFLRSAALRGGISKDHLVTLTAAGLLRRSLWGVLVKENLPDDVRARAAAVCLVLPSGAAVCRGTAAWLFGIDARRPGTHTQNPPLECAVPQRSTPVRRWGVRSYVTDLIDEDVVDVAGVACVSPNRTAVDLARWAMPAVGLGVLDAMARRTLIDVAELLDLADRWRGDRFIARARRLIGLCDPRAESPGESWLRLRFADAGFPVPELQIPLVDESGAEARRLDLGYPEYRYAWEYDGEEHHRGAAAEESDRARRV